MACHSVHNDLIRAMHCAYNSANMQQIKLINSLDYAAPEVLKAGLHPPELADAFACGVALFVMLFAR